MNNFDDSDLHSLEALAEHCLKRFEIPNGRSMVKALGQPDQINNRAAVIGWIRAQLVDPSRDAKVDPYEFLCARLAVVLARKYPHRLTQILGQVLSEDAAPDFEMLAALRRITTPNQS